MLSCIHDLSGRTLTSKGLKLFTEFSTFIKQVHYFLPARIGQCKRIFLVDDQDIITGSHRRLKKGKPENELHKFLVSVITKMKNEQERETWIKDDCHNPRKFGHVVSSSRLQ